LRTSGSIIAERMRLNSPDSSRSSTMSTSAPSQFSFRKTSSFSRTCSRNQSLARTNCAVSCGRASENFSANMLAPMLPTSCSACTVVSFHNP